MSADDSSSRTTAIESRPSCPAGEAHSSRARAQIYDTNRSGWKKRATTSRSLSPPVVPIDRFSLRIISTSARGAETARVRALRLPPPFPPLTSPIARRAALIVVDFIVGPRRAGSGTTGSHTAQPD